MADVARGAPTVETVSPAERAVGVLGSEKLQRLLASWRHRGVAVLDEAVPRELLRPWRSRLDYDAAHQLAAAARTAGAAGIAAGERGEIGHLQLGLPRTAEYIHPSFICNPLVEQFAVAALGDCFLRFVNGNTACPRSRPQQLHVDAQGGPLLKLGVYFPLSDVSSTNGATECWLGSHVSGIPPESVDGGGFDPGGQDRPFVEAWRRAVPPVQLNVPAGAIVFRDLRLWHRGTTNSSQDTPRHVLALHYNSKSDPFADSSHLGPGIVPHTFSEGCRSAFQRAATAFPEGQVDRNVRFSPTSAVDHFGNTAEGEPHQTAFAAAGNADDDTDDTTDDNDDVTAPTTLSSDAATNASATTDLASFQARFVFDFASGSVAAAATDGLDLLDLLPRWVRAKGTQEPEHTHLEGCSGVAAAL
jgi:hypothetical protein